MVFVQPEEWYVEKVFSVQEEEKVAVLAADKRIGVAAILLQGKLNHKTDPHGCQKETLKRFFRSIYYSPPQKFLDEETKKKTTPNNGNGNESL